MKRLAAWIKQLVRRFWPRSRRNRQQWDHLMDLRRKVGLSTDSLTRFGAYMMALDAIQIAIDGDAVEAKLRYLLLPLTDSETTDVAVAMATLGKPLWLDTHRHADIDLMRCKLVEIWKPEWER